MGGIFSDDLVICSRKGKRVLHIVGHASAMIRVTNFLWFDVFHFIEIVLS